MKPALLLALLLVLPGPLRAQAGALPSSGGRVGSAASVLLKGSRLAGAQRAFLGGTAGLVFGERLFLGGGGLALTRDVELPGSESGTGFDLGIGYGGLFLKYWGVLAKRVTGEASLLMGAGHADVTERYANREVGSDNFVVLEPEVSAFYRVYRRVFVGASGGYRAVFGVEDLPRVAAEDLRSFTLTLALRVGGN